MKIEYGGQTIENLHVLKFGFWNAGGKEIRAEDIPREHGPRINWGEGVRVFSMHVSPSDPATGATALLSLGAPEDLGFHNVPLTFDYLNPGDGVHGEVLYDVPEGAEDSFQIIGSLKGSSDIKQVELSWTNTRVGSVAEFLSIFVPIGAMFGAVVLLTHWFNLKGTGWLGTVAVLRRRTPGRGSGYRSRDSIPSMDAG